MTRGQEVFYYDEAETTFLGAQEDVGLFDSNQAEEGVLNKQWRGCE